MKYLSQFLWTHFWDVGTLVPNKSKFLTLISNISVLSGLNLLDLNTIVSLVGHLLRPLVLFLLNHLPSKRSSSSFGVTHSLTYTVTRSLTHAETWKNLLILMPGLWNLICSNFRQQLRHLVDFLSHLLTCSLAFCLILTQNWRKLK